MDNKQILNFTVILLLKKAPNTGIILILLCFPKIIAPKLYIFSSQNPPFSCFYRHTFEKEVMLLDKYKPVSNTLKTTSVAGL